ncbi:addiction module HigA family antidote [Sphingomonas vulcanisoli]|uniref:Addiction module HigA family antidote n=1 Tax=Sphingomonas vulcanisoli TaxID=1658060 RepID=A0ABX0TQC1_9SPHN|nr:HigA family addiction module antitoxin [Sphingomonas vulcanisoli]NIJ07733.1 addiction module HigA family antidote [Sphingomonas vulcanisoli]
MVLKMHASHSLHPGDWLRTELIEPHGLTVSGAADKLGVTRQALSSLLNQRSGVSPDMAIRFEKLFGLSAETLIQMQASYDLKLARAHEKDIHVRPLAA